MTPEREPQSKSQGKKAFLGRLSPRHLVPGTETRRQEKELGGWESQIPSSVLSC